MSFENLEIRFFGFRGGGAMVSGNQALAASGAV